MVKYLMMPLLRMQSGIEVRCAECGSRNIDEDSVRGERSCLDCGLVLSENHIDPGQDWSEFGAEDQHKARAGPPASVLWHDKGLSTEIDWMNRDFSGRAIDGRTRSQLYRMRKWQRRARTHSTIDRNMEKALMEVTRLAGVLGLGRAIKEETAVIYRKALELNMVKGRSIDTMVAASMYLANQKLKTARSLDDFERHSRVKRKSLTRAHKVIKTKLKIRVTVPEPEEYVNRFCCLLGLGPEAVSLTNDILTDARKKDLTHGKSPTGVAAAAVYIASRAGNSPRTQREIADISGVTEVTIRNRYKEIAGQLDLEIDLS